MGVKSKYAEAIGGFGGRDVAPSDFHFSSVALVQHGGWIGGWGYGGSHSSGTGRGEDGDRGKLMGSGYVAKEERTC